MKSSGWLWGSLSSGDREKFESGNIHGTFHYQSASPVYVKF